MLLSDVGDGGVTLGGVLSCGEGGAEGGVVRTVPGRMEDEDADEDVMVVSLGAAIAV